MSRTTDAVLPLARRALKIGREALPAHAHVNSPKKYTQAQLFAILCVRQQLGWTYRQTATRLAEWSDLRAVLGLRSVPEQSTLCYAHRRLMNEKGVSGCWVRACETPVTAG